MQQPQDAPAEQDIRSRIDRIAQKPFDERVTELGELADELAHQLEAPSPEEG